MRQCSLPAIRLRSHTAGIPTDDGNPPLDPGAQRSLERVWCRVIERRVVEATDDVRPFVRDSWARSIAANVEPGLRRAPLIASADALALRCEASPWLRVAQDELHRQTELLAGSEHVLGLFDDDGQLVFADGDPRLVDAMQEVCFVPGALWSEAAVGTSGPGTALALGRPVHVIGAEHFCAAWQAWHCAAVPLRHPVHGDVIGAIDLSGSRERVQPLAHRAVAAIGRAVENAIAARLLERQARLLAALADVTARHPGQLVVAVDEARRVVGASPRLPEFPPGRTFGAGAPPILDELVVRHDGRIVGTCVIIDARPHRRAPGASSPATTTRYRMTDLAGTDPRLVEARRLAGVAAGNHLPVFILGESGVGKEVVAQAIHAASARATGPFIAVNCAAIPKDLIESELFGYVGGAFSGARAGGSAGKIEAASGGTLFLDEVLELGSGQQAALLRVLQEGEVTRVGGIRTQPVDVRVIAATNHDVAQALASGALRRDFYHRLNVLSITLPPLRDRGADLPILIEDMLASACRELGHAPVEIAPEALLTLRSYSWPGNVRELKNVARRLVATLRGPRVELADLPEELRASAGGNAQATDPTEAQLVTVVQTSRTMSEAAARLGIDRSTLYRQLAKYGLRRKNTLSEG
jgi:transcriptional regulator of acetoin/glycerol metabolism